MERKSQHPDEHILAALQGVKRRKTDISELLEECVKRLPRPDNIELSLVKDISDTCMWIEGDRLQRAITDLMTNSVEAMPEGGELQLRLEGCKDLVMITIEDTGKGIAREHMDSIFIPFFTTKPVGEGTGLGLATAYATIKMHEGKMEIESNADPACGPTGTRVKITLPRGAEAKLDTARLIIHEEDD